MTVSRSTDSAARRWSVSLTPLSVRDIRVTLLLLVRVISMSPMDASEAIFSGVWALRVTLW